MLKKFRTSRGFGVHSPFAFSFIQNVLRGKGEYYPYAEISHILSVQGLGTPFMERFSRLLLRLAVYFRPQKIVAEGKETGCLTDVIRLAEENSGSRRSGLTMSVCLEPGTGIPENLKECISTSGPSLALVGLKKADQAYMMRQLGLDGDIKQNGMTFICPGRYLVFVNLPHLPRQDFTLSF